jgi:magnesium chelatase family protein
MDRLDIWLNVSKIDYDKLANGAATGESSETIQARVKSARVIQEKRFAQFGIKKYFNSEMSAEDLEKIANLEIESRSILTDSAKRLELSGRAFHRIIKVSRTIADLAGAEKIKKEHILEALQYRQKIAG